jgi:Kdo2-lipid IVA lauroyltransferase/acyltransferase
MSFYVVRYRRNLVRKNLKNSFPEKSENEISKIERQFYKNLCDYGVETLKLFTIKKEDLMKRMQFENMALLESFPSKNQSIVFLAAHQFNWEWMLVSASARFPMQIDFVYQEVNNPFFERFTLMTRTRFNAHAIQRDQVARELVKRKSIVRGVAIVADQYPGHGEDKKFPATFLNQDTVFFLGINNIAVLSQYPVLFYSIKKVKRGHYMATPQLLSLPPYEKNSTAIIANYVKMVEKSIQDDPAGWLWSHNRWKTRHLKNNG